MSKSRRNYELDYMNAHSVENGRENKTGRFGRIISQNRAYRTNQQVESKIQTKKSGQVLDSTDRSLLKRLAHYQS